MDGPLPVGLVEQWEKFLSHKEQVVIDPISGVCDAVFDDPVLFPLQRRRELSAMLKIASSINPRVVGELGCDKGGSLLHWCLLPDTKRVIACEIRGVPYRDLFEKFFSHIEFCWLPCSSFDTSTLSYVKGWLGGDKINTLFIDSDKSYFEVDFDAYLPMMSRDGIVFFHDIQDTATGDAYKRVRDRGYRHLSVIDIKESIESMERERREIPSANAHETWCRYWHGTSCGFGTIYLD